MPDSKELATLAGCWCLRIAGGVSSMEFRTSCVHTNRIDPIFSMISMLNGASNSACEMMISRQFSVIANAFSQAA